MRRETSTKTALNKKQQLHCLQLLVVDHYAINLSAFRSAGSGD
jgi:hypothetical protein